MQLSHLKKKKSSFFVVGFFLKWPGEVRPMLSLMAFNFSSDAMFKSKISGNVLSITGHNLVGFGDGMG